MEFGPHGPLGSVAPLFVAKAGEDGNEAVKLNVLETIIKTENVTITISVRVLNLNIIMI